MDQDKDGPGPEEAPRPDDELGSLLDAWSSTEAGPASSPEASADGYAELAVSPDGRVAFLDLVPERGGGQPITRGYIESLLLREGVVACILWDELAAAIESCTFDRIPLKGFIVARAREPVDEVPERLALAGRFSSPKALRVEKDGHVDWKAISAFDIVHKGEEVARLVGASPGEDGMDVLGKPIAFGKARVERLEPGEGLALDGSSLRAVSDGRFVRTGLSIRVEPVLFVKGAVDYKTGHIDFPGDVVIDGPIRDGFRIRSGGSLVCKSTLDAWDVSAAKDIRCASGLIGRGKAQVRAGGYLEARFVQNCRVAARGDAMVQNAVVHSRLYSLGWVKMGDRGTIMNSEVWSVRGVHCGRLGNEARQRTVVRVGSSFIAKQKLDTANGRMRELSLRKARLEESLRAGSTGARKGLDEIAELILKLQGLISSILLEVDVDESAAIEATVDVFPGVYVEVCGVGLNVQEPMKKCRFSLDKQAGRIRIDR